MLNFLTALADLIACLSVPAACILASRRLVMYYQLASYQFAGLFRALVRQWRHAVIPAAALAGYIGLVLLLKEVSAAGAVVSLAAAALILLGGLMADRFSYQKREGKSKLALTARVKRYYLVWAAAGAAAVCCFRALLPLWAAGALMALLLPAWVFIAAALSWPVERAVYEMYFRDARKVLFSRPDMVRIGITGSYGKTSVKFYLQTLLSQRYNVLCTRASYNTPMGVATAIRGDLTPAHNVFIAEMGARHRGDIKELCRLVHPGIGVLTAVGPQHLETFGSVENVKKTKYDLIRALPLDGLAVFGQDHGIVEGLWKATNLDKAIAGSEGDDVWAENVAVERRDNHAETSFTLCTKDGRRIDCAVPAAGAHVVKNLLIAAAVALRMGLTDKQIQNGAAMIPPIRNRFNIETDKRGVHIINNGFNSNPVSSAQTLSELASGRYPGRHIVITPGFVELGKMEKQYNRELGQNIAKAADFVLLVGEKRTEPIAEGLRASGFNMENAAVLPTLKAASAYVERIVREGDYVLYENDLPDHYSEV